MRRGIRFSRLLLLLQIGIVLTTVIGTGIVAALMQERQLRDAYRERMIAVARSVATLPTIIDAFSTPNPSAIIQPIAELVRKGSQLEYVVVANRDGIRYSHPDPSKIGQRVSTDPSVPLSGQVYTGTQTGTLGVSWRVKVPIVGPDKTVIGMVSVGILESTLRKDYLRDSGILFGTVGVAAVIGIVGAAAVASLIRKRIYGLEPDEIATLLEAREAVLHGVRDGLVVVDRRGRVAMINDVGIRLLGLPPDGEIVGRMASEVLDTEVVRLLDDGEAEQRLVLSGERLLLVRRDLARVNGRPIGVTLLVRDNSELHELVRDLDGAQGLVDGLRSQAHGFSNTLHVISGLLELGRVEEAVAFIERAGSGGSLTEVIESSGIDDLEVAALLLVKQARSRELGIALAIEPGSALPAIADGAGAEQLRADLLTITGNLLDNAVEACSYGGRVRLAVSLEAGESGHADAPPTRTLVIRVSDDGPGISRTLHDRVFSPGFSSKAARPGQLATDRGIGLTLVRRIAERYGGQARVLPHGSQDASRGAAIEVRLPVPTSVRFAAAEYTP